MHNMWEFLASTIRVLVYLFGLFILFGLLWAFCEKERKRQEEIQKRTPEQKVRMIMDMFGKYQGPTYEDDKVDKMTAQQRMMKLATEDSMV